MSKSSKTAVATVAPATPSSSSVDVVAKWTALTEGQEAIRPPIPVSVLLGEAVDLAELCEKHFDPVLSPTGQLPGLIQLEASGEIARDISAELRELTYVIGVVHGDYVARTKERSQAADRASALASKLRAALSFVLESGRQPAAAERLASVRAEFHSVANQDELALALQAYVGLAREHLALVTKIGVESASIDEAEALATTLREQSAAKLARTDDGGDVAGLRNRLIGALDARMRTVRRAFRYVFRDHPEVARRSVSGYARTKRKARKDAESEATPPAPGAGGAAPAVVMRRVDEVGT